MINRINKMLRSKVIKNSIWLTILQVVNTIIPLLTIPYITRVLGTEEYGFFSIALNWVLYFQVLVEFGFGLSGSRKVALLSDNDKKQLNEIYNNIISSRILLFIFSLLLLNIIAFVSHFSIRIYISMLILFIIIIGTTFQLTWLFQGKQDMKFITIINVISRIISLFLIFTLVKSRKHLYLYCLFYAFTLSLSSIISNVIAHKKYGLTFKLSKMKDIKRVFMYHGAEHKTIFCFEAGEELTVENVRKMGRFHPRCGTSFLFITVLISILVFSFVPWVSTMMRVLYKLLCLPVLMGLPSQ